MVIDTALDALVHIVIYYRAANPDAADVRIYLSPQLEAQCARELAERNDSFLMPRPENPLLIAHAAGAHWYSDNALTGRSIRLECE